MPGIAGIITKKPGERNGKDLDRMLACTMHEPFYTSGTYVNDSLGLYIGWVDLKGSFSDCMPVTNEKNDLLLIYFGENFADKDLFTTLKGNHHRFDPDNASYLIHLYEDRKETFWQELNGWFHGILIDLRSGRAMLFNDRYGMQRIYYHEGRDAFYFASEAKSLLAVCPELRQIDMTSLGEQFCFNCPLENRTLFRDVHLLPGGSVWSFHQGRLETRERYFRPEQWEDQPILEKEYFYEKVRSTFARILPRYFHSRRNIGVSLTGGLDTRMIMSWLDAPPGKVPCYTFGGPYRASYDVSISRRVAELCGQSHDVITLGREFLEEFPSLASRMIYITDGSMDLTGTPELYINRLAREIAPIRVTGDYGSEVLRGVRSMKAAPPGDSLFQEDFAALVRKAHDTFSTFNRDNPMSFNLFKEAPWLGFGRIAIEQSQITVRNPYLDTELVGLMYRAPAEAASNKELSLRLIGDGSKALRGVRTDRGVGGTGNPLASKWCRFFREFTFKAEYAYDYGMPQWLARIDHSLDFCRLEKLFLGRHKFYHFRVWYRNQLAPYVREVLLDDRSRRRPYLNGGVLEKMVMDHTRGVRNHTMEIHKALAAELIHRHFIEQ